MNAKPKILIAVIAATAVVVGLLWFGDGGPSPASEVQDQNPGRTQGQAADPGSSENRYMLSEVASHVSADDCWTVIRGSVYDLTAWVARHPGGREAILQLCGRDGTDVFVGAHGGAENPEAVLQGFAVGVLE